MDDDWCDLYLRMSQDNEAGIDRQETECRAYAERLGLRVRHVYTDNKKSATRDDVKRDAFEEILRDAAALRKAGGEDAFTRVVCWHSDRFARRVKDLLRVQEAGILVYGKESGFFDLSTPAGVATAITVTAWAEYEGKQKALRQKAAHRQRAADGRHFWTQRPFGLGLDGKLVPAESNALRAVYRNVLAGASLNSQATMLNEKGLKTVRGNKWQGNVLRHVLLHPRNAGILEYQGVEMGPGKWEAIVDEQTYRAAVAFLTDPSRLVSGVRTGQGGRQSVMVGFAECGRCDNTVTTYYKNRDQPDEYKLYRCVAGHVSARADAVDLMAGSIIAERLKDPEVQAKLVAPADDNADELKAELDRLRRKGESYLTMLDQDAMTEAQFASLNRKNLDRIAELEQELATRGMSKAVASLFAVEDLLQHWEYELDVPAKHAIVSQFFDRIVVLPRGRGAERLRPGFVDYYLPGDPKPIELR